MVVYSLNISLFFFLFFASSLCLVVKRLQQRSRMCFQYILQWWKYTSSIFHGFQQRTIKWQGIDVQMPVTKELWLWHTKKLFTSLPAKLEILTSYLQIKKDRYNECLMTDFFGSSSGAQRSTLLGLIQDDNKCYIPHLGHLLRLQEPGFGRTCAIFCTQQWQHSTYVSSTCLPEQPPVKICVLNIIEIKLHWSAGGDRGISDFFL